MKIIHSYPKYLVFGMFGWAEVPSQQSQPPRQPQPQPQQHLSSSQQEPAALLPQQWGRDCYTRNKSNKVAAKIVRTPFRSPLKWLNMNSSQGSRRDARIAVQAAVLMTEALVTLRDLGYEAWTHSEAFCASPGRASLFLSLAEAC